MFKFVSKASKGLATVVKDIYADWRAAVAQDLRETEARSVSGMTRKMTAIHTNATNTLQDALDHKQDATVLLAHQLELSEMHRRELTRNNSEMLSYIVRQEFENPSPLEGVGWSWDDKDNGHADTVADADDDLHLVTLNMETLTAEQFDALPLAVQQMVMAMGEEALPAEPVTTPAEA